MIFPMTDTTEAPVPPTKVVLGGFLMGLANLVPGVSGGTMILAMGLYDRFIQTIAAVTRLKLSKSVLLFCGLLALGLVVAVLGLSGPAVWLVTEHRWIAYSLFVGMTLGGVPALMGQVRAGGVGAIAGAVFGFAAMVGLAFFLAETPLQHTKPVFVGAGATAAASMILPGVSGSYLLLIFGLYDVVIGSLRPSELLENTSESLAIVIPVILGAGLGIAVIANVLKLVLKRYPGPSHGVLLGLLLGSVVGLWPFQEAVHPALASSDSLNAIAALNDGTPVADILAESPELEWDAARAEELGREYAGLSKGDLKLLKLKTEYFRPAPMQIVLSILILAAGVAVTLLLGRSPKDAPGAASAS